MHVRGRLNERSPADILEWIENETKTGVLRFYDPRDEVRKDVWFEAGQVVSSGSNLPREWLGQFLIAKGRLSEEDFIRAYRTQEETKVLFGKVLVMIGLVSEAEVTKALGEKTVEAILDVFLWSDGYFEFEDDVAPLPEQRLPIEIDVADVIAEGETRQIEWGVIRQELPSSQAIPELDMIKLQEAGSNLDPRERRILTLAADGKTIVEIALQMHMPEFLLLKKLVDLKKRGFITGATRLADPSDVVEIDIDELEALDDDDAMPPVNAPVRGRSAAKMPDLDLLSKVPIVLLDTETIKATQFAPEEGYLLSRIDGVQDLSSVLLVCPFQEDLALRMVRSLIERRVIALKDVGA